MRRRKPHALWHAAALAAALAPTLLLPACSGGGGRGPAPESSAAAGGTGAAADFGVSAAELAPYEVAITYFGTPQADDALIEEKLNAYLQPKINATVKLQPIVASDYQKRTELMMNTGAKMDLVFTASWLNFPGNVTKGAFLQLDDLLDEYGQGIKDRLNPLYLEAPRLQGKLYAIPTNKEITQGKALTYRKDIVDQYRIPIDSINSLEALAPWFAKVKQDHPEMIDLYVNGGSGNYGGGFMMYETRSNYRPIGPTPAKTPLFLLDYTSTTDMKIKSVLDPEIVDINKRELEMFRDFYEKGYINADAGTSTTDIGELRKQGKIWVQPATWKPGADIEMALGDHNAHEYVSHVIEQPIVTTDLATGSMFAISRTSKDPARAMMVLTLLHTDPYVVNLLASGIEGKHYKKVGANRIEPIPDSGYDGSGISWVVGNELLDYLKPGQPDDLYASWEKFNDEAKRFPLMGFTFDDANVKNEMARIADIVAEYSSIFTGAVQDPVKLLAERNGKLRQAGLAQVQAELQAQIDAWRADNERP